MDDQLLSKTLKKPSNLQRMNKQASILKLVFLFSKGIEL